MSAHRHPIAIAAVVAIVLTTSWALPIAVSLAAEPGVVFRIAPAPTTPAPTTAASAPSSDVVTILEPAGGQFVYSNQAPPPAPRLRFAVGKAPRTEFVFFSPEEQQELRALQDRLTADQQAADHSQEALTHSVAPALPGHRLARAAHASAHPRACSPTGAASQITNLAWPKVVHNGTQVCVPKLEFADKADWRDHVWCIDQGDGHVR